MRSGKVGLGITIKRIDMLTLGEERCMFALPKNQTNTLEGANNR